MRKNKSLLIPISDMIHAFIQKANQDNPENMFYFGTLHRSALYQIQSAGGGINPRGLVFRRAADFPFSNGLPPNVREIQFLKPISISGHLFLKKIDFNSAENKEDDDVVRTD